MDRLGWDELDVLLITGDAYVDHPSFGASIIGRWLERRGYRVGIIAQPDWKSPAGLEAMGRPRLFVGVTAGAMDSMLAHYTAFRKKRSDDAYSPGGKAGRRPNRATIVYSSLARAAFPGLPLIIGGVEASLRRASHYDFWSDRVRRSILLDAKADLLVCGMGERTVAEIARRLSLSRKDMEADPSIDAGRPLRGIPGTAFVSSAVEKAALPGSGLVVLPSHEEIEEDPAALITSALATSRHVHHGDHWLSQRSGDRTVYFAPPSPPLTGEEMDELYSLPFTRLPHPSYAAEVPAAKMIETSITTHRGCGGGCTFCSIALHQGRIISSRSKDSIIREAEDMAGSPDFKGSISDVGGPTANLWGAACKLEDRTACKRPSCLHPSICPSLQTAQPELAGLLRAVKKIRGVKNVRVSSGVRYDLALRDESYTKALVEEFVGGQLKIAPEHVSPKVLSLMRKPAPEAFEKFLARFQKYSDKAGKKQFVVPYLISAFPGCEEKDMLELAAWLRKRNWRPRQVQCFIPTPGAEASAMYHAGTDLAGKKIHVARTDKERLIQHGMLSPETKNGGRRAGKQVKKKGRSRARDE